MTGSKVHLQKHGCLEAVEGNYNVHGSELVGKS